MIQDKTFSVYDCSFGIWREPENVKPYRSISEIIDRIKSKLSKEEIAREQEEAYRIDRRQREVNEKCFDECKGFYSEIRFMMMNSGWTFHQDPYIRKNYRCLADTHHCGQRKDVHFKSSVNGRHIEVKFFEDVIRDNQNGGIYTHDKLNKMPYLRRLRAIIAMRQLRKFLLDNGYTETSKVYSERGLDAVMQHRAELEDFQGKDFYARERQTYNCSDADGTQMYDGDVRYFWHYRGGLQRGVVYRNINNMWWVVTGPYSYTNVANFHLFTWNPSMGRRRKLSPEKIQEVLGRQLKNVIEKQQFERAITLRDLINKTAA